MIFKYLLNLNSKTIYAASCAFILSSTYSYSTAKEFDISVADTKIGTSIGGDLYLAIDDTMNKIGTGTLFLKGDHTGVNGVNGIIKVSNGTLQFDNPKSFGDASKILLYSGVNIQAGDTQTVGSTYDVDNCVLTKALKINNIANSTSTVTVDCNDHPFTLPKFEIENNTPTGVIELHICNKKEGSESNRIAVTLGDNFTQSSVTDKMIVGQRVDLQIRNSYYLAPILGLEDKSQISLTNSLTLNPILLYNANNNCNSIIECNNKAISLSTISTKDNNHTSMIKFMNTNGDVDNKKTLTLTGAFTKGTNNDKIEIASSHILKASANNQLPPKLDMNAGAVLSLDGNEFSLPDIVVISS